MRTRRMPLEQEIKVTVYTGGKILATVKSRLLYNLCYNYYSSDGMTAIPEAFAKRIREALARGVL